MRHLLLNICECALVYAALWLRVEFAGNLVMFLAALNVALAPFAIITGLVATDKEERPQWVLASTNCCDLLCMFSLAAFAWWWCAGGYFIGIIAQAVYRARGVKKEKTK